MNRLSRDVFVQRTQELLLQQGGGDISLTSVLQACGANKGSLYHFFPNGKDELLVAAMERQAEYAISSNRQFLASSQTTAEAVFQLVKSLGRVMDSAACPHVLPFSAAAAIFCETNTEVHAVCIRTLNTLEKIYADSLVREGVPRRTAKSMGSLIASAVEGALLQSRARKSSGSLKHAAVHLRSLIQQCVLAHAE